MGVITLQNAQHLLPTVLSASGNLANVAHIIRRLECNLRVYDEGFHLILQCFRIKIINGSS